MPLSDEQNQLLDSHLQDVRLKIIQAAEEAVSSDGKLEIQKLISIASDFAQCERLATHTSISVWSQITSIFSCLPGIIWVSAMLAVTFGLLSAKYPESSSLSDMAKVFAGAIVGASGAGGMAVRKP